MQEYANGKLNRLVRECIGSKVLSVAAALAFSAFMLAGCGIGDNPVESGGNNTLKKFADEAVEFDERLIPSFMNMWAQVVNDNVVQVLSFDNEDEICFGDDCPGFLPPSEYVPVTLAQVDFASSSGKPIFTGSCYTVGDSVLHIVRSGMADMVFNYTLSGNGQVLTLSDKAETVTQFTQMNIITYIFQFNIRFDIEEELIGNGASLDFNIAYEQYSGIYGYWGLWYPTNGNSNREWVFSWSDYGDVRVPVLSISDEDISTEWDYYCFTNADVNVIPANRSSGELYLINMFRGDTLFVYTYEISDDILTLTDKNTDEVITLSKHKTSSIRQRGRQLSKSAGGTAGGVRSGNSAITSMKSLLNKKK
ncbi:MAG: hypothetical protein LBI42_08210 [Chitinispirillales bacterium]|jgi:hypothetical protein|nr:hypothetical protein [Chitinispirillales bacterium]